MLPDTLTIGQKIKIYFMPLSILFSFWISGIIPVFIIKWSFEFFGVYFWIFLPIIVLFCYALFMLFVLLFFLFFRSLYSPVPDGKYSKKSYEYHRLGVRHAYYRVYTDLLRPINFVKSFSALYKLFGAKIGEEVYVGSIILNPERLEIGDNCFLGNNATLTGHIFEGDYVILKKIKIGNSVTIGTNSTIFPGVEIGDNAVIGAMAIIPFGKKIPKNSVWIGAKPKRLKRK